MKHTSPLYFSALLLVCLTGHAVYGAESHVKATLLADVSAIHTPKPFTIGVFLEVDPGWHIYWSNPGDAGLATAVKFKAPDGFTVAPDPFPVPRRFQQAANEIAYGYETAVLITAKVTPPDTLHPGDEINFEAAASWLVCKEECMPGKASTMLKLKVQDHAGPANVETFNRYASTVVPSSRQSSDVAEIKTTIDANAHAATVVIHWKNAVSGIDLFPAASDSATISHIEVKKTENNATPVTFKFEPTAGGKLSDGLKLLIAYTDDAGRQRGVEAMISLK